MLCRLYLPGRYRRLTVYVVIMHMHLVLVSCSICILLADVCRKVHTHKDIKRIARVHFTPLAVVPVCYFLEIYLLFPILFFFFFFFFVFFL